MAITISREAFTLADSETKLLLIYDILTEQHDLAIKVNDLQKTLCERRCNACDTRFKKIERRKIIDAGLAAGGGAIGGFFAVILKMTFWK